MIAITNGLVIQCWSISFTSYWAFQQSLPNLLTKTKYNTTFPRQYPTGLSKTAMLVPHARTHAYQNLSYSKPCPPSLLRSPLSLPSPSGCTFWGKKPWSRKKKILWQLGTLVGAPVGIALIAGIAIPAMIIGIPVYVGRKVCSISHSRSVTRALSSPSLFLCSQSVFLFLSPSVFVSLSVSQSPS